MFCKEESSVYNFASFFEKEFLDLFHNHINICAFPDKEKKRFISWKEFQTKIKKKTKSSK